jgi:hypothetical protein
MDKIWTNPDARGDKIIAIVNDILYKVNPRDEEIAEVAHDLKMKRIPQQNTFSLPMSYIREMRLQEGKEFIQVFFRGKSEEHLMIKDSVLREEIFNFFKKNTTQSKFYLERYSKIKAAKKPLIALLVVAGLWLYTAYFSIRIADGTEFEIHGPGLGGIAYFLATLGPAKNILIFGGLAGIALLAAINNMRNPPVLHRIILGKGAKVLATSQ